MWTLPSTSPVGLQGLSWGYLYLPLHILKVCSQTVAVPRLMIFDGHIITGEECGPNFLTFLRLRENLGETSTRKLTPPVIEPGSPPWEITMLLIDHSDNDLCHGGICLWVWSTWVISFEHFWVAQRNFLKEDNNMEKDRSPHWCCIVYGMVMEFYGASTLKVIGADNEMIFYDYVSQSYSGMDGVCVFPSSILRLRKNHGKTTTRKIDSAGDRTRAR